MSLPLILQIQQDALNKDVSVTDALRKAKVACTKLGLLDFGKWVDQELRGYVDIPVTKLPEYRKLHGIPEAYNPYHGWQPLIFQEAKAEEACSFAPVGMSISAIEESLRAMAEANGFFEFPYPTEMANRIRRAISFGGSNVRLKIAPPAIANIVHEVRNILLEWTMEMEKEGILGKELVFSLSDREKSAKATDSVINNISIGHVGAFVQSAAHSVVQGETNEANTLAKGVSDLVQQVGQMLPASGLSDDIQRNAREALQKLEPVGHDEKPDTGRLRNGLEALKRALAPAGEHILRFAVDEGVKRLIGG